MNMHENLYTLIKLDFTPNGALINKKAAIRQPFLETKLFVHYVHGYFKAKTHFGSCWCCPHDKYPFQLMIKSLLRIALQRKMHHALLNVYLTGKKTETLLMIIMTIQKPAMAQGSIY